MLLSQVVAAGLGETLAASWRRARRCSHVDVGICIIWTKTNKEATQEVFETQNLRVLQNSFKKSEILQILEMLQFQNYSFFQTYNVGISTYSTVKTKSQ
jgi:hypothetical protein